MKKKTLFITQSALIAALYVAVTYLTNLFGMANGAVQVRLSEALTVLPAFLTPAVPGLFVGCILANILTGCALWDILLGSFATLIGAIGTKYFGKNAPLAALFPILANTLIVPFVLKFVYHAKGSMPFFFLTIFAGEFISCGILGGILYKSLKKANLFKK